MQYTRPVLHVPISTIKKLPKFTPFTLIGMNDIDYRPSGEEMLIKKNTLKVDPDSHRDTLFLLKPSQIYVINDLYNNYTCLTMVITSLCTSIRNFYLSFITFYIH